MIKLDKNLSLLHRSYSHKKKLPLSSTLNSQQTLLNKDAGSATSTSSFKHCFLKTSSRSAFQLSFSAAGFPGPTSPHLPSLPAEFRTSSPPSSQHFLFSWLSWHCVPLISLQNHWLLFLQFFCQILLPLLKLNVQKTRHLFPLYFCLSYHTTPSGFKGHPYADGCESCVSSMNQPTPKLQVCIRATLFKCVVEPQA